MMRLRSALLTATVLATAPAWGPAFGQQVSGPSIAPAGATVVNLTCDGATDNGAVITGLNASATAGTTYLFPAATSPCLTSVALAPPASNITYTANPGTVTLKPTTGATGSPLLFSTNGVSNILVYGLSFDGGGVNFSSQNNVLGVFGGNNVVFDHISIQNTNGLGLIFSTSVTNSGVRASYFNNIGNHWISTGNNSDQKQGMGFCCGTAANNYGNFVINSTFAATGLDAISVTNQTNFLAEGNIFKGVGGRYTNGGAAIYASANSAVLIVGNLVNGTYGNGIDVNLTNDANITGNHVLYAGGAGIAYAAGSWASIIGNYSCNSNQSAGLSSSQSGIALVGVAAAVTETTVAGNTVCDTQGTPTQTWGIQETSGGTYTNVWIDQSNTPDGNVTGPFGGALSGYTPLKLGTTVSGITQTGSTPNYGVALEPTGTGALTAAVPNSAASGGNARGANAVDWQSSRQGAAQVASGADSVVGGGQNNTASNQFAVVLGGQWNVCSGAESICGGGFTNSEFRAASFNLSYGEFAAQGDSQAVMAPLRATTTGAGAVQLTATGGGDAATTNILNVGLTGISINHAIGGTIIVTARSATPDAKVWTCTFGLQSGSGASTVSLMTGSACASSVATTGAATWALTLAADATNGGLNLQGAGATGVTVHWTATVYASETGN